MTISDGRPYMAQLDGNPVGPRAPPHISFMSMDEVVDRVRDAVLADAPCPARAQAAVSAMQAATGARWVGVYTVVDGRVHNEAWSGPAAPAHPDFDAAQGLTAHAIAARAIAVSNNVGQDPRYLANQEDSGSELIIPVVLGGHTVGTLDIESDQIGAFDGTSIARFEAMASALRGLWSDGVTSAQPDL